mmetsp:Transcript_20795/g.30783  ORF Transcript_20795/g.30783 Transcript_20795/m.30783 type:complete len:107 (-) Transcript_20795:113-433(-)
MVGVVLGAGVGATVSVGANVGMVGLDDGDREGAEVGVVGWMEGEGEGLGELVGGEEKGIKVRVVGLSAVFLRAENEDHRCSFGSLFLAAGLPEPPSFSLSPTPPFL